MRSIYRSKEHGDLIKALTEKNPENSTAVFPTIKALMCFAAVLGFEQGRRAPFSRDQNMTESIEWHTFSNTKHDHYIYLLALAETNDLNILNDTHLDPPENANKNNNMHIIFEDYANGGLEILQTWLKRTPGDPYGNKAILIAMEKEGYLNKDLESIESFEDIQF